MNKTISHEQGIPESGRDLFKTDCRPAKIFSSKSSLVNDQTTSFSTMLSRREAKNIDEMVALSREYSRLFIWPLPRISFTARMTIRLGIQRSRLSLKFMISLKETWRVGKLREIWVSTPNKEINHEYDLGIKPKGSSPAISWEEAESAQAN